KFSYIFKAHIFSNRSPSQKLSKPVPTHGLIGWLSRNFQVSVLPVSVGSFPTALRTELSRKMGNRETKSTARTSRCTVAGFRTTEGRIARSITPPAMVRPAMDVVELHATSN